MVNLLTLTGWETKVLEIVFAHLPTIGTTASEATVQSVLDAIDNTPASEFSDFLDTETQLAARASARDFAQNVLTANQAALMPETLAAIMAGPEEMTRCNRVVREIWSARGASLALCRLNSI